MDEVDTGLVFIMNQLNNIKKDFRKEWEHDRDINRSETVSGKTQEGAEGGQRSKGNADADLKADALRLYGPDAVSGLLDSHRTI